MPAHHLAPHPPISPVVDPAANRKPRAGCGRLLRMEGLNLGGFLFGNINEEGALEDETLDEVRPVLQACG